MSTTAADPELLLAQLEALELKRDAYVRLLERSTIPRVCEGYQRELGDVQERIDALQLDVAEHGPVGGAMVEVEMADEDPDAEEGVELEIVPFEDVPTPIYGLRTTAPYPVVNDRFRPPGW